jgi:hypothetical protein
MNPKYAQIMTEAFHAEIAKLATGQCRKGRRPIRIKKLLEKRARGVFRAAAPYAGTMLAGAGSYHFGKKELKKYQMGRQMTAQMRAQRRM